MNSNHFRIFTPAYTLLLCVACMSCGSSDWKQFRADGQNQGNINANSLEFLDPKWSTPADVGQVSYSSPVIGDDGAIYIGTVDGKLVAVNGTGTIKWRFDTRNNPRLNFQKSIIVSAPVVGTPDDVYVIVSFEDAANNVKSALVHVRNDGTLANFAVLEVRPVSLPSWTTSSPKVLHINSRDFVFVSNQGFLYVFDSNCQQITRQDILYCTGDLQLGIDYSFDYERLSQFYNGPYIFTEWHNADDARYWIDPSVAIVTKISGERLENPLIIVATNKCGIQAFEWTPPPNPTLTHKWNRGGGSDTYYSSPAVSTTGELIIAYGEGYIVSKEALTGKDNWLYQVPSQEPVLASTSFYAGSFYVIAASLNNVYVIENNSLVSSFQLPGETVCSPAVSYDRIYLSSMAGMHSLKVDLSGFSSDASMQGGMSSPAIDKDGTVYFVSSKNGKLIAYKGR